VAVDDREGVYTMPSYHVVDRRHHDDTQMGMTAGCGAVPIFTYTQPGNVRAQEGTSVGLLVALYSALLLCWNAAIVERCM
jgi:hypothetical protein